MKKNIKYPLGGIISSGIGLASNIITQLNADKQLKISNAIAEDMARKEKFNNDNNFLRNYNSDGSPTEFYKKGGMFKLNTRTVGNKSHFKPITSNVYEVKGPTHANGGVKLGDAEVEGGELIKVTPDSVKVLSNSSDYYGYSPAKATKSNPSSFDKNFNIQEGMKSNKQNNTKIAVLGNEFIPAARLTSLPGSVSTPNLVTNKLKPVEPRIPTITKKNKNEVGTGNLAPYFMDNISNLVTTLSTPKVQPPSLMEPVKFKTDVDISPQVNEVRSNERANVNFINKNISDANVATTLAAHVGNTATASINSLISDKNNRETELKNAEAEANIYPNMYNNTEINKFKTDILDRSLGIGQSISNNVNNFRKDLIDIQDKKKFDERDMDRVGLEISMDSKGVLADPITSTSAYDRYILNNDIDLTKIHPDTAKAIELKRAKLKAYRR